MVTIFNATPQVLVFVHPSCGYEVYLTVPAYSGASYTDAFESDLVRQLVRYFSGSSLVTWTAT
jgi:hypothetical protein